jgi:SAM-dependent methyltransferase
MLLEQFRPVITDRAFPFLKVQQGRIAHLAGSPNAWREAYTEHLRETYEAIKRFIPETLTSVLDVGGGMGGFDALLAAKNPDLKVAILDGMHDWPALTKPDQTHSNAYAAAEFLEANGVSGTEFFDPAALPAAPSTFDLILSLQAWGFHFPPSVYMKFAFKASRKGTVWILDVRIMQRFWASDLFSQQHLEPLGEAPGFNDKYTRMAFLVV